MHPFAVVDDFFEAEDLQACIEYAQQGRNNRIERNQAFADRIWRSYSQKLLPLNPNWVGLYEDVTLTNSPIPIRRHQDQKRNAAEQKLLVYLNSVEHGGTIFYLGQEEHLVENRQNRLVCFDISLYHQSQPFSGGHKLAIGFRPIASSP